MTFLFISVCSTRELYLPIISLMSQYSELRQLSVLHASNRRLLPVHHHIRNSVPICTEMFC